MKEVIEKVVNAWWSHLVEVAVKEGDKPEIDYADLDGAEHFLHPDIIKHIETVEQAFERAAESILVLDECDFKHRLATEFPGYTFIFDGDKWLIVQEY